MSARSFASILKGAPAAQSVHVPRTISRDRKKPRFRDCIAASDGANKHEVSQFAIAKVDDGLGLAFGWALVCKKAGADYFDLQGDHIPEGAMLEAATEFMLSARHAGDMHARNEADEPVAKGTVVFAFPLTCDIAKAMNIQTGQTGLMIAMKPSDPAILAKFKSGEYTGFSIGGRRIQDKEYTP